ncbi:hypothetical protein ACCS72_38500, partial [Rhizobium ruizarguesonis]
LLGEDVLSLPSVDAHDGNPTETLQKYLETLTGLKVSICFLYSVYEGKSDGKQHIVYHAEQQNFPAALDNGCKFHITFAC